VTEYRSSDARDEFAPAAPSFYIAITRPTVTYTLIGINIAVFVAMIAFGVIFLNTWRGPEDIRVLYFFGAKVNAEIQAGQVWRLFTAMFLHIGAIHLLFNLYALFALGPLVEGYFGHLRFIAIYLLGGLFGSVASYAFSPNPSAGASGAIFGLAGATTIYFLRYRNNFGQRGRAILQNMLVVIGINLVFGLSMSGIDNWGHMGGLVGGALVAWGLLPRYQRPQVVRFGDQPLEEEARSAWEIGWVALCSLLLWAGLQLANQVTIV
jgi:rhomboid protease GluP